MSPSRVIAAHRGHVVLDDGRTVAVHHRGPFPVVGDLIGSDGTIEPRRTVLRRAGEVLLANADAVAIVVPLGHEISPRLLERLTALARDGGAEPLLLLTKGDLATDAQAAAAAASAAASAPALALSVAAGWGLEAVRATVDVPGRITALLGRSGAGKSTLLNALAGDPVMATAAVRRDGEGRHTTTRRRWVALPGGGAVIDTPGVRLPRLHGGGGIAATFPEIDDLAAGCRFADCAHDREPGCAVQAAIAAGALDPARLDAARQLEREARHAEARHDGTARAARKARERAAQQPYNRIIRG